MLLIDLIEISSCINKLSPSIRGLSISSSLSEGGPLLVHALTSSMSCLQHSFGCLDNFNWCECKSHPSLTSSASLARICVP